MTKILVVDDDNAVRTALGAVIKSMGHVPLFSPDGQHALETLRIDPDVKLVITDVVMPRMDGRDLVLTMRDSRLRDIPVILKIRVGSQTVASPDLPVEQLEIQTDNTNHTFRVLAKGEQVLVPVALWSVGKTSPAALSMDKYGVSTAAQLTPGFHVAVCHFRRQTSSCAFYVAE